MTKNQLDFWKNQETERSNRANEAETHRANVERETEQHRSAVAKETEDLRHHTADENINMMKALTDQDNYKLKLKQWQEGGKDEVAARIDKALSEAKKTRGTREYMIGHYYDDGSNDARLTAGASYAVADQADAYTDILGIGD